MTSLDFKRTLVRTALAAAALLAVASTARAEPYLAQREGYRCSQCHVNRTGGGKRNDFGYQYGLTHLRTFSTAGAGGGSAAAPLAAWRAVDPRPTDTLGLGMDVRLSSATVFADELHNGFESREANLYVEANLSPNVSLYLDTSVAEGSVESREAFVLLTGGPFSLKAGYFLMPFGLRVWGDGEFIRRETGYTFATPDLGVELGWESGPFAMYVAASNGSNGVDSDNWKKLSAIAGLNSRYARAGLSGSTNKTRTRTVHMAGPYAGVTLGRLSVLGELDLVSTRYAAQDATVTTLVGYAEAAFLLRRGLTARLGYGFHDPDLAQEEDQRLNLRAGLDFYPVPFFGLAAHYNVGRSVPQDEIGNAKTLTAELHVFF